MRTLAAGSAAPALRPASAGHASAPSATSMARRLQRASRPGCTPARVVGMTVADMSDPADTHPSRRRANLRVAKPELRVLVAGRPYSTLNWSLGGMLLRSYTASHQPGDRLALIAGPERSTGYARLTARVVRADPRRGQLALAFDAVAPGSLQSLA